MKYSPLSALETEGRQTGGAGWHPSGGMEDQEDARAVNEALASGEKGIPLEEAITEIEREAE